MPVYKYKTFEQAEKALWMNPLDDNNIGRLGDYFNFLDKCHPIRFHPGIFKFRTLEDANRHRDEQEASFAIKVYKERFENKE